MYGIFLVPYYSREPRRASCVRGFSFYMARCSRLWRVSFFVNASRAVPGADTRSGFLLLPESGRSRLSPASFPGFVCGQCPEPIRAPAYSSYLRRSAYRLRRPKHRSAAPDRSVKISHGRIRAVSPVGGVTPGSSDSPGVSSR